MGPPAGLDSGEVGHPDDHRQALKDPPPQMQRHRAASLVTSIVRRRKKHPLPPSTTGRIPARPRPDGGPGEAPPPRWSGGAPFRSRIPRRGPSTTWSNEVEPAWMIPAESFRSSRLVSGRSATAQHGLPEGKLPLLPQPCSSFTVCEDPPKGAPHGWDKDLNSRESDAFIDGRPRLARRRPRYPRATALRTPHHLQSASRPPAQLDGTLSPSSRPLPLWTDSRRSVRHRAESSGLSHR